jgi:predicted outer membrane repeat protein
MKIKVALWAFLLLAAYSQSQATVVYVDASHTGGVQNGTSWATAFPYFQSGINAAQAGDSVWVAQGTYLAFFGNHYTLKDSVKIFGGFKNIHTSFSQRNAHLNVTILKGNDDRVIENWYGQLSSATMLDGFTIKDGKAGDGGGGMLNQNGSNPIINDCIFKNNTGLRGAGMLNINSTPAINNCTFIDNVSFSLPAQQSSGAGMYNSSSSVVVNNCIFTHNISYSGYLAKGGGVFNSSSNTVFNNCEFSDNACLDSVYEAQYGHFGGGFYDQYGTTSLNNCTFTNNTAHTSVAGWGGGMAGRESSFTLTGCTFSGNGFTGTGNSSGGALYTVEGSLTLMQCTFSGNYSKNGGAIYTAWDTLNINDCLFSGNGISSGGKGGGAIYNKHYNNVTEPVSIRNCVFTGNKATETHGGAIYNEYGSTSYKITGCTFIADSAKMGGAIFNDNSSPLIVNSLFLKNVADSAGGAIFNGSVPPTFPYAAFRPTIKNCTIAQNLAATEGSGIYNHLAATPQISNTIIWGNNGSGVYSSATAGTNAAYSLIQGMAANSTAHLLDGNTDPLFIDAGNGNYRLQVNSVCIDASRNDSIPPGILTDIVGADRIWGGTADMGAYEYNFGLDLGSDTSICVDGTLTLDAQNQGSSYLWNNNETTQTITVNASGDYTVEVTNTFGTLKDTITVTVLPLPIVSLGNDTTINQGITLVLNAGNAGASYLWSTGAITQTIAVTAANTYSVRVTNGAGCAGTDTIKVTVNPLGIDGVISSDPSISIRPNPATSKVTIRLHHLRLLNTRASLTDAYGREIQHFTISKPELTLSLDGLAPGLYLIKMEDGATFKLIKG